MARFDLFRKYRWPVLASLLLLISLLGHVGRYWHWSPITQLDNQLYDYRLNATLSTTIDERIVIVDIDEKSLAEQGRWPWRRDKLATMVNTLFADYQIRQLGFDIVFAEPDDSAGLSTLNMLATGPLQADAAYQAEWAKLQTSLNVDQRFALSLKNRPVVLGYYFNFDDHRGSGKLPAAPLSVDDLRQPLSIYAQGFGANLPILANAAPTAGHFNPIADPDGVMRRAPLLVPYQGALYEALSLAMFRQLQGTPPISLIIPDALGSTNHIVEKLADRRAHV